MLEDQLKQLKQLTLGEHHFTEALNDLFDEGELRESLNNAKDEFYEDTEYLDYLSYFKK